jgi:hypothetical protein
MDQRFQSNPANLLQIRSLKRMLTAILQTLFEFTRQKLNLQEQNNLYYGHRP